jgi:hypothetical protein
MDAYRPLDVKEKVLPLLSHYPAPLRETSALTAPLQKRTFWLDGSGKEKNDRMKIRVMNRDGFSIDRRQVDLRLVEQIISSEQVAALAEILRYLMQNNMGCLPVREIADRIDDMISQSGPACIQRSPGCGLTRPRREEICAMLNRCRK